MIDATRHARVKIISGQQNMEVMVIVMARKGESEGDTKNTGVKVFNKTKNQEVKFIDEAK